MAEVRLPEETGPETMRTGSEETRLSPSESLGVFFRRPTVWGLLARWMVRWAFLIGAVLLLSKGLTGGSRLAILPAGLSPNIVLCGLIAAGTLSAMGGLAIFVALLAAVRLRWFCRWVCPLGTCNELCTLLGKRMELRCPSAPHIGQYLIFATLTGAVLGFPILLWFDPLALFSSLGQRRPFKVIPFLVGISGLLLAIGVSFLSPGMWCLRICPLGALQEILFVFRRSMIHAVKGLFRTRLASSSREISSANTRQTSEWIRISRRGLIGGVGALVWTYLTPRSASSKTAPLRPPGASSDERRFLALCVRCGNCMRVCPTGIIVPQRSTDSLALWLTPQVTFADNFCDLTCTRCAEVCPSGALVPFSVAEKPYVVIGKAVVELDECLLTVDRECGICRSHCPYQAIRLQFNEETYSVQPVVDLSRCPGCGACEAVCPTTPRKAIRVTRVGAISPT